MLTAYFCGSAGDQVPNSRIHGKYSDDYAEYGRRVGQYAVEALDSLVKQEGAGIKYTEEMVKYPSNKKNMDKLTGAYEVQKAVEQFGNNAPEVKAACQQYGLSSRHAANWTVIRSKLADTTAFSLRVLTVGELAFAVSACEIFGAQGRFIKDNSPYSNTVLITCADGPTSYLASTEGFDYECYESECCYYERGSAEKAAQQFVDILKTHKGE